MTKLAIIIASYNCKLKLQMTLRNVMMFSNCQLQIVVVDGNSTDGTFEFLHAFSEEYEDGFKYISEPDTGIANAWNKGLQLVNAEYVTFLNCGDFLASNYFSTVIDQLQCRQTVYFCDSIKFSEAGEVLAIRQGTYPSFLGVAMSKFGFAHPGSIIAKSLILELGGFNETKSIAMDTHLLLQCFFKDEISFQKIFTTAYFETGGISDKHFYQAQRQYYSSLAELNNFHKLFCVVAPITLTVLRSMRFQLGFLKDVLKPFKHLGKRILNSMISLIPSAGLKSFVLNLLGANIGDKTTIATGTTFTQFSNFQVGADTVINANCYIDPRGGLKIGNNVNIMRDCKILTAGHNLHSHFFELQLKNTTIGDDVVVFSNVFINPGVHIGNAAVILPCSNVVCDVPDHEVWGGNPAKFLYRRPSEPKYKNHYFQVFGL